MTQLTPMQQINLDNLKAAFDALCILPDDLKPYAGTRYVDPLQRLSNLRHVTSTASTLARIEYSLSWTVYKTKEEAQATMNEWLEELANNGGNFTGLDLFLAGIY